MLMGGVVFHTLPSGRFKCPRPSNPQLLHVLYGTAVFWFHESPGRVAPILTTILDGTEEWTPVLQSGDGGWAKPWAHQPAAVEIAEGDGLWRVCQITLPECIAANPAARLFALNLLTSH